MTTTLVVCQVKASLTLWYSKIRIARSEAELLNRSDDVQTKSIVSFSADSVVARRPTIRDLTHIIQAIDSVAPSYNLLKVRLDSPLLSIQPILV